MNYQKPDKVEIFVGITEKLSEENLINFSMTINDVPVDFSGHGVAGVRWSYPIVDGFFRDGISRACTKGVNFLSNFLELERIDENHLVRDGIVHDGKLLKISDNGYQLLSCTKVNDPKLAKKFYKKLKYNLFFRLAMNNFSKVSSL